MTRYIKSDIMIDTMTKNDVDRVKGRKIKRLENLAKACADAKDDDMKKMWFDKLIDPNEEAIICKAGWLRHPSTQWVIKSAYNYIWLYKHMMAMNDEYKSRYNHTKDHLAVQKLGELLKQPPKNINIKALATDATPAMPDECIVPGDSVASYRKYYIMKKVRFATWKAPSKMPQWFKEGVQNGVNI